MPGRDVPRPSGGWWSGAVARTVVQMLAVTGKRFTLDGLWGKLREFYLPEGNAEVRVQQRRAVVLPLGEGGAD